MSKMFPEMTEFLRDKENQTLLNEEDFKTLYKKFWMFMQSKASWLTLLPLGGFPGVRLPMIDNPMTSELTKILITSGINPLDHMDEIPASYLSLNRSANLAPEFFEIPDHIKSIDVHAFSKCKMKEINIPKSVEHIGHYAFSECKYLEKIEFPDNIKQINTGVCMHCCNLKEIKLPAKVEIINAFAFTLHSTNTIKLPKSIAIMHDSAFTNSSSVCLEYEGTKEDFKKIKIDSFSFNPRQKAKVVLDNIKCLDGVVKIENGKLIEVS